MVVVPSLPCGWWGSAVHGVTPAWNRTLVGWFPVEILHPQVSFVLVVWNLKQCYGSRETELGLGTTSRKRRALKFTS